VGNLGRQDGEPASLRGLCQTVEPCRRESVFAGAMQVKVYRVEYDYFGPDHEGISTVNVAANNFEQAIEIFKTESAHHEFSSVIKSVVCIADHLIELKLRK
jgi:hypothetical protein